MTSGCPVLPVVAVPVAVCLGPHRHEAVGATDDAFEKVVPLAPLLQRPGPTIVLRKSHLNLVEKLWRDCGLMDARVPLVLVPDPAGIEFVVEIRAT